MSPLAVLGSAFAISAFCGLASLLQSKKALTVRAVLSSFMYSGATGLIVGLLWFNEYGADNPYFMLGVAGLAGIGGVSLVDVAIATFKKSGLSIKIATRRETNASDSGTAGEDSP